MRIYPINNEIDISRSIDFLRLSFKWSKKKASNIKKNIIINNNLIGIYGYMIKDDNDKIYGAILIFYQGILTINNKQIRLINMSSWFVNTEVRGHYSIKMIKTLMSDFSEYLITNLTANNTAYKILKKFGFKDSLILNRKITLFSLIFNKKLLNIKFKDFNNKKFNNTKFSFPLNLSKGNAISQKIKVNNSYLHIISSPTIWEKKIWRFCIKIRGTRLLWTSNQELFNSKFYQILFIYCIRNISFFITTHFDFDISNISYKSTKQIYFFKNSSLIKDINLSVGSELSII